MSNSYNYFRENLNLDNITLSCNFLSVSSTTNSIGIGSGGSVNINGGLSIIKDVYIGGLVNFTAPSLNYNNTVASIGLGGANKWYVDNRFNKFIIDISQERTIERININSSVNSIGLGSGGSLNVNGGVSIAKQLFVGGVAHFVNTSNSTSISTGSVIIYGGLGVNGTINTNLIDSSNIFTTNFTTSNIISTNITTSNIISTNITTSNIISTNITTSNMFINNVNMTPSSGDLFKEQSFNASANLYTPDSITGFVFNNNVRYFTGWLSVFITTSSTNTVTAFTIEGIQLNTNVWNINSRFVGTNIKMKISITNSGQIQYTCPGIPGFISSVMKFRSITTSV